MYTHTLKPYSLEADNGVAVVALDLFVYSFS